MCNTHEHYGTGRLSISTVWYRTQLVPNLQLGPQGLDLKPHPQDCLDGLQHLLPAMEVVCERGCSRSAYH